MRLLTHVACVRPNFCAIAPTLATRHQSLTCTLARSCQSSYVDMKVARSAGMRFTPLMMEEDETYVNDIAVEATCMVLAGVGAGGSKQYAARLRLCSSSLVLEPETMDLPMVRFAFKAVSNLTVDSSSMITFRVSSHTILRNVGEYSSAVSVNRQEAYTLSPQYSAHQSFAAQLQKVPCALSPPPPSPSPPHIVVQIWDISHRPGSSALDNSVLISRIMHDHSKSLPFDAAWLVDGLQKSFKRCLAPCRRPHRLLPPLTSLCRFGTFRIGRDLLLSTTPSSSPASCTTTASRCPSTPPGSSTAFKKKWRESSALGTCRPWSSFPPASASPRREYTCNLSSISVPLQCSSSESAVLLAP